MNHGDQPASGGNSYRRESTEVGPHLMPDQANADAALQGTAAADGVVSTQDNQLGSYAEPLADGAVQSAGDEPLSQSSSNSNIARERMVLRCNEAQHRGKQSGLASLEAYRDAGAALRELKELLPRGDFGPVAQARCGCSKQWRAQLMRLDREWDNVLTALRWAESSGRQFGRKAYSVDGALALIKAWRRAESGAAPPNPTCRTAKPSSASLLRENAVFKYRLNASTELIKVLEEELAKSRSAEQHRQDIDAPDRDEIRKLTACWLRGGTDGESYAAARQLHEFACRLGWDHVLDLVRACEGKVDWTFATTTSSTSRQKKCARRSSTRNID
jgi:hypothetical protein